MQTLDLRAHTGDPQSVIDEAFATLDPAVIASLDVAIKRVRTVHGDQLPMPHTTDLAPGASVSQRWVPVDRVGLYVPGGRAVYPSSVVMNVVPAQLAGVQSIAIASPPQADFGGWPHPTILAAARMLGIDEVYAAGGAQAIAWFAFGQTGTARCHRNRLRGWAHGDQGAGRRFGRSGTRRS